ncbi:MAG: hypothetical protein LBG88_00250 [Christensenellaceae bacterium]|jgi:hypothetical protein|nr:hypothetical protein [Christensenellaceae bacterium]
MEKKEVLIACAVTNKWGYVGVGRDHGPASDYLDNPDVYIPRELNSYPQDGAERMAMTNTGRLLTMKESWDLCDEQGLVKREKAEEEDFLFWINSSDFKKALDLHSDPKVAIAFAEANNQKVKKRMILKYPPTIEERFAMRGDGD